MSERDLAERVSLQLKYGGDFVVGFPTADIAVEAYRERGHVYDFEGKNCEECAGWDGESHRCDCGNRRMYWEVYETAGNRWLCYATAY